MLLVETYLDESPGKGFGLFANTQIKKGQKYWQRNEVFDKVISISEIASFPKLAADYIRNHGFLELSNNWYICGDNARFSNHSSTPNTKNFFDANGLIQYCEAEIDIEIGDEILCDYREICLTCKNGVWFEEF